MKRVLIFTAPLLLAACSTVSDYYPSSQVVTVDGVEYMVRPLNKERTSWQATPNRPDGRGMLIIDASIYMGNVKAIEKATGCPVFAPSVKNQNTDTIAAADCSARTNAPPAPEAKPTP